MVVVSFIVLKHSACMACCQCHYKSDIFLPWLSAQVWWHIWVKGSHSYLKD